MDLNNLQYLLFLRIKPVCFVLCMMSLFISNINAQTTVDFSADMEEGCAPLLVQFTNLTEDLSSYTYYWDFGNGNTSTSRNPIATYANAGFYTISLTVFNEGLGTTTTKTEYIKVYSAPEVDFSPQDTIKECAPIEVSFTSTITPESDDYTYVWAFGDGSISSAQNPTHSYETSGIFDVTLIATSDKGCSSEKTYQSIVQSHKPEAIFDPDQTESCDGELSVTFTNYSTSIGTLSYKWSFGDGDTSDQENPTHLYTNPGTYDVSLTVSDQLACADTVEIEELIEITSTQALFEIAKDTICTYESITFSNTSTNNRKNAWDFGDGSTSEETSPQHSYAEAGDYTITLTIDNYDCNDYYEKTIHVDEASVNFSVSSEFSCEVPVEISYTPEAENITIYDWRFGNGSFSSEQNPVITYVSTEDLVNNYTKSYTDTLIVTNNHGCTATAVKENSVTITIPEVNIISDNSTSGCTPLALTLSQDIEYNTTYDNIQEYSWSLDGTTTASNDDFSYSYTDIGEYTVTLTAITSRGCIVETDKTIEVGQLLDVDFIVKNKDVFCANEQVEFENTSEDLDLIDNTVWEFGDGEISDFGLPYHFYTDTGYMDVTLRIYNNGCLSSVQKNDVLYINGPISSLSRINQCDSPYNQAQFSITLNDAESYTLDLGDGNTISNQGNTPTYTYAEKGSYELTLTAENATNGCSFTNTLDVWIQNPTAYFDTINTKPCINTGITFDPANSEDTDKFLYNGETGLYLWDFGDDSALQLSDEAVSHTYSSGGTYISKLIIKDTNNCPDTISKTITIYEPEADFSSNYKEGCLPVYFEFTDNSSSELDIDSWKWNFGDGESSSEQNPIHEYLDFGNYNVSLTITDILGCSDSKTLNSEVSVIDPDANFSASDVTSCINDSITFSDESISNIEAFYWDFGDGTTSTLRNPKHAYDTDGDYDVSLKIIDDHGCEETYSVPSYINIQKAPVTAFTSDLQESDCYPFIVQFFDESSSENLNSWEWSFGDNLNASNLQNPYHIYTTPGEFNISLIAYTSNGCADTITKEGYINIGGPYAEINLADTACIYNQISFSLTNAQNISSLVWDFGDGNSSTDSTTTHQYQQKGKIYPSLYLTTDADYTCNKIISDSIYIYEIEASIAYQDNVDSGCIPFDANMVNNSYLADSYVWTTSNSLYSTDENPTLTFTSDGEYTIELIAGNQFGCYDTTSTVATAFPLPEITTSPDTFICYGDNILIWAEGGIAYEWDNAQYLDDANIDQPIASPGTTTSFKVLVSDENTCENTDSVKITVQQYPTVNLSDTTIIIGESVQFNIAEPDIKDYLWKPNTDISCISCSDPIVNPLEDITYTVEVTDTSDCFTMEYNTNITVEKKYSVDVPSAFTPNNDGINDVIYVNGWGIKELIYFKIYNRFGELIFNSTDISTGWDGKFKGNAQGADIYNFIVKVETYNNTFLEKKGNIQLIR